MQKHDYFLHCWLRRHLGASMTLKSGMSFAFSRINFVKKDSFDGLYSSLWKERVDDKIELYQFISSDKRNWDPEMRRVYDQCKKEYDSHKEEIKSLVEINIKVIAKNMAWLKDHSLVDKVVNHSRTLTKYLIKNIQKGVESYSKKIVPQQYSEQIERILKTEYEFDPKFAKNWDPNTIFRANTCPKCVKIIQKLEAENNLFKPGCEPQKMGKGGKNKKSTDNCEKGDKFLNIRPLSVNQTEDSLSMNDKALEFLFFGTPSSCFWPMKDHYDKMNNNFAQNEEKKESVPVGEVVCREAVFFDYLAASEVSGDVVFDKPIAIYEKYNSGVFYFIPRHYFWKGRRGLEYLCDLQRHMERIDWIKTMSPRYQKWYTHADVMQNYKYDNDNDLPPKLYPDWLTELENTVCGGLSSLYSEFETSFECKYGYSNCVMINGYLKPEHWVKAHDDRHQMFVEMAPIVGVSIGGSRNFKIIHQIDCEHEISIKLNHGDIHVHMEGTESTWKHEVSQANPLEFQPWYSATFRLIANEDQKMRQVVRWYSKIQKYKQMLRNDGSFHQ